MRKSVPHIITLLNLFFGCCALVYVFNQRFDIAFFLILFGAIADYSDGMAARLLDVRSELGKELDSLADMVSFGVVPGVILYQLLLESSQQQLLFGEGTLPDIWGALPGFLFTVFACLRLARFNIDTRQSEDFIGLNTPSATTFVVGLMLIHMSDSLGMNELVTNRTFLYIVIVVLSYLMIAEIPMFSLKFKGLKWKGNEKRIVFLCVSLLALITIREAAFSLMIILYVGASVLEKYFGKADSALKT